MNTKIRTIIALAATLSVVASVGPVAPVGSADFSRAHYEYCHDMKQMYEEDIEKYAKSQGTDVASFEEAVDDLKAAEAHDCGWAAGLVRPPTKGIITPPTPAGALSGPSSGSGTVRPPTPTAVYSHL
jgi:hypothetical protein